MEIRCSHCKTVEGPFSKHSITSSGRRLYYCNSCNTKRVAEYRKTPSGKEAVLRAVKKYESNNSVRTQAWRKVHNITKQPCEVCGEVTVHRHHPDPLKPLEVKFLCPYHHKQAHRSTTKQLIWYNEAN